jgi:hypothetical protein
MLMVGDVSEYMHIILIMVFWFMPLCDLIGENQHCRETYCLHPQSRCEEGGSMFFLNVCLPPTRLPPVHKPEEQNMTSPLKTSAFTHSHISVISNLDIVIIAVLSQKVWCKI